MLSLKRRLPSIAALLGTVLATWSCARPPVAAPPFVISTPYEIDSLDPHARDLQSQVAICANFYEPLVSRDADLKLQPALALRWFSPTPLTWVFELRPDVKFHDGRPFTAEDVVATFERLRRDGTLQIGLNVKEVESVRALGPLRVELRTRRPQPILLNRLSLIAILPGGIADPGHPGGTGPYRFVSWERGVQVTMARHDGYWGARPALPLVSLRLGQSPEAVERELREGGSQIAILASQAVATRLAGDPSLDVVRRTGMFLKFLAFALQAEGPFRDPRVRQALSLAIDRKRLVGELVEPAVPAYQLVPPTVFGYDPALPELRPDPERARALLREAGFGGGFAATLHARRIAGSASGPLAKMLAAVGIKLTAVEQGEAEFARSVATATFTLNRFGCETGDASDMLSAAMHATDSSLVGATAPGPAAAGFVQAMRTAVESDQPEVRNAALMQIMAAAMQQLPVVPLYFDEDVYAVRKGYAWRPRADGYVLAAEVRPTTP
jgi:peptide/nickel transport system substrate-binding protein